MRIFSADFGNWFAEMVSSFNRLSNVQILITVLATCIYKTLIDDGINGYSLLYLDLPKRHLSDSEKVCSVLLVMSSC